MNFQSHHNILDMAGFFRKPKQSQYAMPLNALEAALQIVAQAHEDHVVAAPRTATPNMIRAARMVTSCSAEELQKIYQAMLQAW